jgi:hypothetical protein
MTGGAGFSKQAEQSLKDNYSLGKIRPRLKFSDQTRTGENASIKAIDESIRYRYLRKTRLRWTRSAFFFGLIIAILMFLIFW